MELTINKTVQETINVEDGFYSLEYTQSEGIVSQCSIKGTNAMMIKKSGDVSFLPTKFIIENYHLVKNTDDTQFREALQNLASKIENFY